MSLLGPSERVRSLAAIGVFASLRLTAQTPPQSRLVNALPSGVPATELVVSSDTQRVYYTDSSRALWLYVRATKTSTRLVDGAIWDLTIGASDNLLAYRRVERESGAQHVFILPVEAHTGLATGRERRVSTAEGDSPAVSPNGESIAYARDDSIGVGQSVVVVPVDGGRERTIVPIKRSSVGSIRWSKDGRTLFYALNPPVRCIPEWSCLPLTSGPPTPFATIERVASTGGASTTLVTRAGNGWPGLSPDGSLLVYSDTGFFGAFAVSGNQLVVADSTGRKLATVTPPGRETIQGWLPPATLLLSDRGDVRLLLAFSLESGNTRLLLDTLDLTDAAWAPNGERFSTVRCTVEECAMNLWSPDGTPREVIPLTDRYAGGATWSPDGSRIAYFSLPLTGDRHISVVDIGAGRTRELPAAPGNNGWFMWSADSRALIASTLTANGAQRKVVFQRFGLDGSVRGLRELTIGPAPSTGTAISEVAAIVFRDGELHRVGLESDSSDIVVVSKTAGRYAVYFPVSPNGQHVAARHSTKPDGDVNMIEVMSVDGRLVTSIETPFPLRAGASGMRWVDDQHLIVAGGPWELESEAGAYLVDIATKQAKKLLTLPYQATGDLAASPDGRILLYGMSGITTPRVFTLNLSHLTVRK